MKVAFPRHAVAAEYEVTRQELSDGAHFATLAEPFARQLVAGRGDFRAQLGRVGAA